ncbi:hypothetical protein SYNPS1DRAFT_27384 [Syncephalis pseudoplumigaleata]|uniref:Uncharacterized protein n=1 Tax=Syncephalis pseudoplumigaleata TaxID=1712513 RepID=A0A4P9Z346_9FUNG|nr:hypothetical protein SYNPS1DRAFT_27384 [Syncephalis pseudoplumigaleata]|eukprot:RKP26944.1 hypothetical protein SYNPS1DRAFT_27384 [Syncephalis pseudoplumigaleata]
MRGTAGTATTDNSSSNGTQLSMTTLPVIHRPLPMAEDDDDDQQQHRRVCPAQTVVLDAASLLLDAHLPRLVLSPEAQPLLRELQALVRAEVEALKAWELLRGVLGRYWLRGLKTADGEATTTTTTRALSRPCLATEANRMKQLALAPPKPMRGRKTIDKMARSARAGNYGLEVLQFQA